MTCLNWILPYFSVPFVASNEKKKKSKSLHSCCSCFSLVPGRQCAATFECVTACVVSACRCNSASRMARAERAASGSVVACINMMY